MTQPQTQVSDNQTPLTTKEGWFAMVAAGAGRTKPALPAGKGLADLTSQERKLHRRDRIAWHANLPPLKTRQMAAVHDAMQETVESNQQNSGKVKPATVLDAPPGLGKTCTATTFGRRFHQDQIDMDGPATPSGNQRIPVAFISLSGNTTIKMFASKLANFYGHPSAYSSSNEAKISNAAANCMIAAQTQLVIVDEVHFLDMNRKEGRDLANHFKGMANDFPVTFIYVGVGLAELGLFTEGRAGALEMSQIARRWTRLTMSHFDISNNAGRHEWKTLLKGIERNLVLHNAKPGMLADDLADYLYARSTGHWGSLDHLIQKGCYRAITQGEERLTEELLNEIRIDEAAETTRPQLEAAFAAGRLTSRPTRSRSTR